VTSPPDLAARHAWRGALVAASLNAMGMLGDLIIARDVPAMPWYPSVLSAAVGAGLVALLLMRQQHATVRLGSVVFLINIGAILAALWVTSPYWASSGRPWTPFQAHKLGALAVPLVAPQLSVGLVAIAGFTATAIGGFFVLDPAIQRGLPVGEPWVVLPYALFASVLLGYRLRSLALEREMLRLHAESAAAEHVAQTFLRLRDYANTPIQTIAFTAKLIRAQHPDLKMLLDRLDRAVERLTDVSRALTRYESTHKWSPGDESLDAATLSERLPGSEPKNASPT
jgi:hypothetical protein